MPDSPNPVRQESASGDCTCTFAPPRHNYAVARGIRYAIYLDDFEDATEFDPACPYHGDNGTMVVNMKTLRKPDPVLSEAPETIMFCIGCDQVAHDGEYHDTCPDEDGQGVLVAYVRADLASWQDPSMPKPEAENV